MLMKTDAGTGFMHESFRKNDPKNFTRAWIRLAKHTFQRINSETGK